MSTKSILYALLCLHKHSLCYSMNFLFFQPKSQFFFSIQLLLQNVFVLKVFILIQLLSTANAKDINTDYFITNSILASGHRGSVA